MFAEDVGLSPADAGQGCFSQLPKYMRKDPAHLPHLLHQLGADMNTGSAFSPLLRASVPGLIGGLFADPSALPVSRDQIDLLIDAAGADWGEVEPTISGTLLERALEPSERHKLNAHYTPRAYVERLVLRHHVRTLIETRTEHPLVDVLMGGKGFTGRQANALLGRRGAFWDREYDDRCVRDGEHYAAVVR